MAEDTEPGERILEWYGSLPARIVDLVGDYAGKELFLVEGDSLLLRCFSDPKIDLDGGFQLLHAVYAVEYFLKGLVQRKCNFHVVFFEKHEGLCIPRGTASKNVLKYILARTAIIRHLSVHLRNSESSIELHEFMSYNDLRFRQYLSASGVYFVMCHDGANPVPLYQDPLIMAKSEAEKTKVEREEATRKIAFRVMICWLISQGYNVALINGLEWADTKVMTMVVEGSRRSKLSLNISEGNISTRSSQDGQIPLDLDLSLSKLESSIKLDTGGENAFNERAILTILTLAQILQKDSGFQDLALAFLIHTVMIGDLRISSRRQCWVSMEEDDSDARVVKFLSVFATASRRIIRQETWSPALANRNVSCDIADLVDGRLFRGIVYQMSDAYEELKLPQRLEAEVANLAQALHSLCGIQLQVKLQERNAGSPVIAIENLNVEDEYRSASVLPFSNRVFDRHLKSIKISVSHSRLPEGQSARIFREASHWHNAKRRLDPKVALPVSEREKSRALRKNQFFMAEMQAYAASLTNAAGKVLEPEIVTVSESTKVAKSHQEIPKPQSSKAVPKGKGAGKKAQMLEEIAASKAVKDGENVERTFSSWQTVRKNFDSEHLLRSKYSKTRGYLRDLPQNKRTILQAEIEFYLILVLLDIYRGLCKRNREEGDSSKEETFGIAALLWNHVRRLSISTKCLTKTIANHIKQIVALLELPAVEIPPPTVDRRLSFEPNLRFPDAKEFSISTKPQEFQLLHCGPYMDRNLDSAPDSRVPFEPDGWQRKVLDELDAERSVFVVAPTSAGKTFISFYAMERILRSNDDSVLVYVAPTKALVNQIAAEVQARFKKTYKHAGKSVWAIHTRDYRVNNPSGCQILVTVPHILQIMLLSPSNAKTWSPRVRYIIFDEIHSIGQAEDGVVWEQLLLLAPCPIIALSATVGNPEQFNSWLESTQQPSGFKLTMVTHQHRYSDLRKFVFYPPKKFSFQGLAERPSFATLGLDGVQNFAFLHPVASLVNKSRGLPDDLSLEARDCLTLFWAMERHRTDEHPVDKSLDPSSLPKIIRKAHIIEWEKALKTLLKQWMTDQNSPFDKVLDDLSKSLDDSRGSESQISKRQAAILTPDDLIDIDSEDLLQTTLPLICRLHERDALPAIFFNYDRSKCEKICQAVLMQLVAAEQNWKENSPAWKAYLSGWEQWKKDQTKMSGKKAPKIVSKKKGKGDDDDDPTSKADRVQDAASDEASPYASFDPEAPVDGFHFAVKQKLETSELARHFWQLRRRGIAPWLMEALTRGIGVHHAGMNRKYRQVVEMLFRKGYLRIVIATGTLALGINMPCATVVFSDDSVFLTALNFRQAAGRAGRRGFDLLGNVVFQNLTTAKVCRLLSSRLPDLNGHFPVTTTLVLRLFSLLEESGESPYAIRAINSLLSQPRLYLDGPAFKDQVLHHLRFSIEYLRRQSLLSAQGTPINFAGLTSHLYFTENSSFAINVLLKEGYFHNLCSEINEKTSSVLRTLMVVLAHLFGRRPCRAADQEYVENVVKRSPSIVFLPPLPPEAAGVLRQHNQDTLQIFTTYVRTFVDQHVKEVDCKLPLTGIEAGGSNVAMELEGALPRTHVRSAFVALSGHGDEFDSISDLCRTTRGGVFLEEAVIPHLDVYPDESKTPLNAYLYDFYMHGDIDAIEKANGVRKSDVWFMLNDFSMVLATITTSLANFLKLPDSDLSMLDIVGEGDEQNAQEDDRILADVPDLTDGSSVTSTQSERGKALASVPAASKARTKKKVVDSWDDDDNANDDDDIHEIVDETHGADMNNQTVDEIEEGFLKVYKAFSKLKLEFDEKFHAMFA